MCCAIANTYGDMTTAQWGTARLALTGRRTGGLHALSSAGCCSRRFALFLFCAAGRPVRIRCVAGWHGRRSRRPAPECRCDQLPRRRFVPRQPSRSRDQPQGRACAAGVDGEAAGAADRPLQLSDWEASKGDWLSSQGHETMSRGKSRALSDASTDLSLRREGDSDLD